MILWALKREQTMFVNSVIKNFYFITDVHCSVLVNYISFDYVMISTF